MKKAEIKEALVYLEKVAYIFGEHEPIGNEKSKISYEGLDSFLESLSKYLQIIENTDPDSFKQKTYAKGYGMNYLLVNEKLMELQVGLLGNKISFNKLLQYRKELIMTF